MSDASLHRSTLAEHPDIRDILPRFVARLPAHVQRLRDLYAAGNLPELQRLVHQLHGTGKSFGFAQISTRAAAAEAALLSQAPPPEISRTLNALITYIQHVEGYIPTRN